MKCLVISFACLVFIGCDGHVTFTVSPQDRTVNEQSPQFEIDEGDGPKPVESLK